MNADAVIPQARYALIGGSGTWGARFPEDLGREDVRLVRVYDRGFETPYGRSAPFKLLEIAGAPVLRVAMHGVSTFDGALPAPWIASHQVASVFKAAGVRWAITEGSTGGLQNPDRPGEPLPAWNAVITHDFMTLFYPGPVSPPFDGGREGFVRMGAPFCPVLRQALYQAARKQPRFEAVYNHGVYVCGPPERYETAAEVKRYAQLGGHVVGHTVGHEAPLMRLLGVHFAAFNFTSNVAESDAWGIDAPDAQRQLYRECPPIVAAVVIEALKTVIEREPPACACNQYLMSSLNEFPVPGA